MPDRKYAGKTFMWCTMEHSPKMYNLSESTKRKVSLSTFFHYQPKFVKLQGRISLRQSCCECCLDFENILQQASKYLKGIPQELNKAIDASMCSYDSYFPNIDCILWKCDKCCLDKFKDKLIVENDAKLDDNWKRFLVKEWVTKTKENKESTDIPALGCPSLLIQRFDWSIHKTNTCNEWAYFSS